MGKFGSAAHTKSPKSLRGFSSTGCCCEGVTFVGATWFSCGELLDWLLDEVPRLISRNTATRNSPAKIAVIALSVVTSVVSVVVVILVNVDIAVIASGVSVEVVKLVSV
jgi:hypothetical protein